VQIHLHKVIPAGAGLGGGSADGAFTLKLLNQQFNLDLSTKKLIDYALQLGSDCPFFIINKPCYATGRGEILEPINLDLSAYKFILINPGIKVSTAWAFAQLSEAPPKEGTTLKQIIQQPVETWKNNLTNDFEEPVFKHFPEIKIIKEKLYETGAVYASMSGSGSTVYGIFKKETGLTVSFGDKYFVKELIS
jgi:4-diphosphocytidyl-2-C-methyl-D-erythritol kinase